MFEFGGARGTERSTRDREIVGSFERECTEMRITAHQHDVEDGEVERRVRVLGDECHVAGDLSGRPLDQGSSIEHDRTRCGCQRATEHFQECRLARPIGTKNTDQFTSPDLERHVPEHVMCGLRQTAGEPRAQHDVQGAELDSFVQANAVEFRRSVGVGCHGIERLVARISRQLEARDSGAQLDGPCRPL